MKVHTGPMPLSLGLGFLAPTLLIVLLKEKLALEFDGAESGGAESGNAESSRCVGRFGAALGAGGGGDALSERSKDDEVVGDFTLAKTRRLNSASRATITYSQIDYTV